MMALYYIRWPNGQHTLALASDKYHLWHLLDETADPSGCRLKKLPARTKLAFDFSAVEENAEDGDDKCFVFEYQGEYETTHSLQDKCVSLLDSELLDGKDFFKGCFDVLYPGQPEQQDRIAKMLGVTR